jgi:hypothetical protein
MNTIIITTTIVITLLVFFSANISADSAQDGYPTIDELIAQSDEIAGKVKQECIANMVSKYGEDGKVSSSALNKYCSCATEKLISAMRESLEEERVNYAVLMWFP